ncbi:homoserine dehydrogenase [Dehalococcoidia bacterium]|nr:homoserine dehydrogenase [Dehalococcoidia bacterium]
MSNSSVGIGLLGMGVVGGGVVAALHQNHERLSELVGRPVDIKRVLVRDTARQRSHEISPELLTTNVEDVLGDPEVDIVVEVLGGQDPALDYILRGISQGHHIVTANKEVVARHGPTILGKAREKGVQVLFEATVAGGTPIIAPLLRDLVANEIIAIHGIINGTTNYILTRMAQDGAGFEETVDEARRLGYAEADPTSDIEGIDAACKLAILATLAFRTRVEDSDVYREGIRKIKVRDFLYAHELGYTIKLLAIADYRDGGIQARVHPTMVPDDMIIAKVDGVLNAVEIQADLAGKLLFHGAGAGERPTTSAVVADIVDIARNVSNNVVSPPAPALSQDILIRPMSELETRYYLRLSVTHRPGVLAQICRVLGEQNISIASAIQKETDEVAQSAELVLMTDRASESAMQSAMERLVELDVVSEIGNMLRVEEW